MSSILLNMLENTGVIIEGEVPEQSVTALVLISLFTDARAESSDTIPDGTADQRGWPGDSFYDAAWGSKLWLLYREKLTTDVRNRAVKYAEDALAWMTKDSGTGKIAKSVTVEGSIPRFQTLALIITITKPDETELTLTVSKRWEAQSAL
ncbi:phage GP46 family protein [Vibrio cholerae]|nr:phage GP46 family protein [Vibrio cholerae]